MAGSEPSEDVAPSEPLEFTDPKPADDRSSLAYSIFFLLGTGFLLPWNAFITAIDYFALLYPSQHVDAIFSVAYMIPNLTILVLLIVYIGRTPPRTRISIGFFVFFLLVALVPVLDFTSIGADGVGTMVSFILTVSFVACSGVVDALIQGSLFGMAAELPPQYTQALTAGTSASGLITSAVRIATKVVLPGTESGLRWSAYLYFAIASFVLLCCVWAYQVLNTLPIVLQNQTRRASFASLPTDAAPLLEVASDDASGKGPAQCAPSDAAEEAAAPLGEHKGGSSKGSTGDLAELEERELLDAERTIRPSRGLSRFLSRLFYLDALTAEGKALSIRSAPPSQQWDVLSIVWPYAASITLVYVVTLSIFPGFISELKVASLGTWYPILLMAAFNVCDFLGKMTPVVMVIENDGLLFALVLGRFLFYPLYSACLGSTVPAVISQVILPLLTACLGFSNGLLTSLLMMSAPAVVQEEQAEATGTIMVLFLVLGLTLGSVGAWLWVSLHI